MASNRIRLNSLPSLGGVASGVLVALLFAILPDWRLHAFVDGTGLALVLPMAAPPLGNTARALLATGGGLFTGATAWAALYLLFGPGGVFARVGGVDGMPKVRVADAHPDAPPRRPLSAAELGSPSTPDAPPRRPLFAAEPAPPVERELPRDLEQPLAAFDPAAIPDHPREPVRAVEPLAARPVPLARGERIDSFEISSRYAAQTGANSIEALLARLEEGTVRRYGLQRAG